MLLRYEMIGIPPDVDLDAALQAVQYALAPAPAKTIKSELARLRATTISRNAEQIDLAMTFAAYGEALAEYPADIVIDACRYWGRNEKWWPALAELRERMDRKIRSRRLLAEAISCARRRAAA